MTRCTRCGREASTWVTVNDHTGDMWTLDPRCYGVVRECFAAIATIQRYANSVHAGGVIARLREVAADGANPGGTA